MSVNFLILLFDLWNGIIRILLSNFLFYYSNLKILLFLFCTQKFLILLFELWKSIFLILSSNFLFFYLNFEITLFEFCWQIKNFRNLPTKLYYSNFIRKFLLLLFVLWNGIIKIYRRISDSIIRIIKFYYFNFNVEFLILLKKF